MFRVASCYFSYLTHSNWTRSTVIFRPHRHSYALSYVCFTISLTNTSSSTQHSHSSSFWTILATLIRVPPHLQYLTHFHHSSTQTGNLEEEFYGHLFNTHFTTKSNDDKIYIQLYVNNSYSTIIDEKTYLQCVLVFLKYSLKNISFTRRTVSSITH